LRDRRHNQAPLALTRMVPDSMDHPSIPTLRRVGEYVRSYPGPAEIVWGDRDPVLGGVRTGHPHRGRTLRAGRSSRGDCPGHRASDRTVLSSHPLRSVTPVRRCFARRRDP
jgi:hypothetical protein